MEQKEFLSLHSASTASFLIMGCLGGCSKKETDDFIDQSNQPGSGTSGKKDFTLNLDDAGNTTFKRKGNALVKDGIIVAYTNAGSYKAVAAACNP